MSLYKQQTKHLGIPVLGYKDRIHPDMEMRKYTIIENMLIAGTQGLSEVVFDDGSYTSGNDGSEFYVRLAAGGSFPSARGIIGGFYFHASPELKWTGLKNGYFYYLYLKATPKTPYQCDAVREVSSTFTLGRDSLLLATIDFRDEVPVLNTEPDGKVYSADVARHASDSSNPHGRKIEQEELEITKSLVLRSTASIVVGELVIPIDVFVSTASEIGGRRVERVEFVSCGPEGVVLKTQSKVWSVIVQRRAYGRLSGTVGEVGVGYFGEDDAVDEEREFCVYNTGDEGIPMYAIVICG